MTKALKIVIIGSGMAGYMLAQSLRQESQAARITIIAERDGRFYPKPMLSTALFHKKTPKDIETASAKEMESQYNLEVKTCAKVKRVDLSSKEVVLGDDEKISYDKLVLATGSSAKTLGAMDDCTMSVNGIEDYERLLSTLKNSKKVLVIGSGLVGVEFSHDLLTAGYDVSMFSLDKEPLSGLVPKEVGKVCKDHLINMGMKWLFDKGIESMTKAESGVCVDFCTLGKKDFDVVLSAIGIVSRTELAEKMNCRVNKGIVTDRYGKTSIEDVYAIGDCAEVYGLNLTYVAPIKQQAKAISQNLLASQKAIAYPAMPVVVKMPTLPLTLVPVRGIDVEGSWKIEKNKPNEIKAGFYDRKGSIRGFVLLGEATKERNDWLKKMPESILD